MDMELVKRGAAKLKKIFPKNRLIKHLERCALCYGCPNAKNLFLSRYEAPLPTSPACNAQCAGCISYQPDKKCPVTQPRIKFIPMPDEIAQIALYHIDNVKRPIVSFGQGCEGEPLLSAGIIEKAIRSIRRCSSKGVINMNTNGSRPDSIARLFDAGLDSIRVSLNSAREEYYIKYYKPKDYSFGDLLKSIKEAKNRNGFVSLNYLSMPGFTDSLNEINALKKLIEKSRIDMIQWRNLNYDPLRYFKELDISVKAEEMFGIKEMIGMLGREFPMIKMGYFNDYESIDSRRV
jgi:MoaA/NifB/PqqE/SkfB family radical SAM enzyme